MATMVADLHEAHEQLQAYMKGKMAQFEAQYGNKASAGTITHEEMPDDYVEFKRFALNIFNVFSRQIQELQCAVDNLEAKQRSDSLLLYGLPESKGEMVRDKVVEVIKSKCVPDFDVSSLRQCYRLGRATDGVTRSVIVCFSDKQKRREVWMNKIKLKGSKVTMREFLTKPRQAVYQRAREHFGFINCWTQDAVIHIKLPDGSRGKLVRLNELEALIKAFPCANSSATIEATVSESSSKSRPKRNKAK